MLDFGCGQGDFLNTLAGPAARSHAASGSTPSRATRPSGTRRSTTWPTVAAASVDLVCCFETLEHLYDDEIASFLDARPTACSSPGGEVLISVPVIGGPTLLLKEANRAVLFRRRSDYSARELLAASLGGAPGAAARRHPGHPQGLRLPGAARPAGRAVRGRRRGLLALPGAALVAQLAGLRPPAPTGTDGRRAAACARRPVGRGACVGTSGGRRPGRLGSTGLAAAWARACRPRPRG